MCLSGLINFQFNNLQSAFGIRVDARNKNQEIRLNSAWLEILVLAFFNVSLLPHSSIGLRCSTLVSVRISYLVFPFSSSSFFNRRSIVEIGLDSVFRISYIVFQTSFLPHLHRFHFSLLVQDFAVIRCREEDKIGQLTCSQFSAIR